MQTKVENATPMLRTEGAARFLGLTASTLEKLRLTGNGPRYAKLGRSVVYDPADLSSWVEQKKRSSTSVAA